MATFNFILLLNLSLVLAVAASSNPNTFGLHRRDHADLGRLVKKRTPAEILANQPAAQATQGTSAVAQTSPATSVSVQTTSVVASVSPSAVSPTF